MALIDLIEKLQGKPEMIRRRILVGTTFSIIAIIFFIWVSVRLSDVGSPSVTSVSEKNRGPITEVGEAIGGMIQSFGSGMASIKNMFSSTSSAVASSSVIIK